MTKVLKVINPFYVMEKGDTFEFDANKGGYTSSFTEETHEDSDTGSVVTSKYSSDYTISPEYAQDLITAGYLSEQAEPAVPTNKFINVFDEITSLLDDYKEELKNIDDNCANLPACMKVERETVLSNMIKLLEHLNSLKK